MKNLSFLINFRKNKFKEDIFWNYLSLVFLALSGIIINFIISINYSAEILGVFNQVLAGYIVFAMIGSGVNLKEISNQNLSTFKPNKDLQEQYLINHKNWKEYIIDSLKN